MSGKVHRDNRKSPNQKDLLSLQAGIMMSAGQMPGRLKCLLAQYIGSKAATVLTYLYSSFLVFQSAHLGLLFIVTTYDFLTYGGELEQISNALTMAIIFSYSCFTNCYWWWLSDRLQTYLERINQYHRRTSLLASSQVGVDGIWQKARNFAFIWQAACVLGVFLWGIAPLILRQHVLPLNCWYPFDPLHPGIYKYVYIIQLIAQVHMGNTFGSSSSLIASLVIVLLGQFDILYCSLKKLPEHAMLIAGIETLPYELAGDIAELPTVEEDNQYIFAKEIETDPALLDQQRRYYKQSPAFANIEQALRHSLIDCIKQHRFLLSCCDELESLFNSLCLVKSLQITLQLCLLVFVFVEGSASTIVDALNLVQYVMLTLTELLIFTYFGELLGNHTAKSADAFWRSNWYTYAPSVKRDILIFMINSRRVVRLTAGKFYTMDVDRLRSVVTQAISFLTLLQKLAAKRDTA